MQTLRPAGQFISMRSTARDRSLRGDGTGRPDSDYASNSARSLALDHFGCRINSLRMGYCLNAGSTGIFADPSLQVMAR